MTGMLELRPRWEAVGVMVTQNTRDLIERRYNLSAELVSWFKSLAVFREVERESMILKEPTAEERDFHKAVLAMLIAAGERLRAGLPVAGEWQAKETSIRREYFEAALEHLYDTQAVWHGEMTALRKAEILKGVLRGEGART